MESKTTCCLLITQGRAGSQFGPLAWQAQDLNTEVMGLTQNPAHWLGEHEPPCPQEKVLVLSDQHCPQTFWDVFQLV